jgi:DNA-directed RNA polymerase alpha subunit
MAVVQTTVYLPEELWHAMLLMAVTEGDVNTVVIRALEEYLARSRRRRVGQRSGKYKQLVDSLSMPVTNLHLSARAAMCLQKLNVQYVYDLVEKSPADLLVTRNFGKQSLREIRDTLAAMGLTLGMTRDNIPAYREAVMATVAARIKAAGG